MMNQLSRKIHLQIYVYSNVLISYIYIFEISGADVQLENETCGHQRFGTN